MTFRKTCFAGIISWLAFVAAIFMGMKIATLNASLKETYASFSFHNLKTSNMLLCMDKHRFQIFKKLGVKFYDLSL